jgi:ssDNA-binding Zn-finger/Zn-ribbon topoisomerase 1
MKAKCKDCGETEWLLEKNEKRYYYAVVNPTELRWIERLKHKEVSPYSLICSKCEGSASTHADLQYTIKEKPLKVIWQTAFWDNLSNQSK